MMFCFTEWYFFRKGAERQRIRLYSVRMKCHSKTRLIIFIHAKKESEIAHDTGTDRYTKTTRIKT